MKIDKLAYVSFAVLLLSSSLVGAESKYPAADFQPKVVYQDTGYKHSGSSSTKATGTKSTADPKYPAANFEPEVLYQDTNYKHNEKLSAANSSSSSDSSAGGSEASDSSGISSEILGLIVLVLAGLVFYSKRVKPVSQSNRKASSSADNNGSTGVAAYLSRKLPKISGVDKYLESRENYPSSGVAKYMAKRVIAVKEAATLKVTGVEKYVRKQ